MDEPRTERNRVHLDVTVPHDEAEARIAAALDAGGTLVEDRYARSWWVLADADGNERASAPGRTAERRPFLSTRAGRGIEVEVVLVTAPRARTRERHARRPALVDSSVYWGVDSSRMGDTTTVRADRATHDELKRLARERGSTVAEPVARAVRVLRQEHMGQDLANPLESGESEWLDADLG